MRQPIDCDLLTGFLGSGKTTLLNAWLRAPQAAGTAVVVNEVGDIGIDQLVLAQVAENLTLLESGCLCCTLNGSLRETLLDLCANAERAGRPLTRIVVETTGLAEPLPILHTLLGDRSLAGIVRLNQVVVTVDGAQGLRQLDTQPESVRQLAAAEVVVLTKTGLADAQHLHAVIARIAAANPLADVVPSDGGGAAVPVFTRHGAQRQRVAVQEVSRVSPPPAHDGGHGHHCHDPGCAHPGHAHDHAHAEGSAHDHPAAEVFHDRVVTHGFYVEHTTTWAGVAAWWNLVSSHYGDDLLRCKGLLRLSDAQPPQIFVQTVGKVFHTPEPVPQWPDADPRSRLVCIGAGLERPWLVRSLAALRIDEPGLLPSTLDELDSLNLIPSPTQSENP